MYEVDQYTVSLLHFDNGLTDECGKVWTAQNGATVSNVQSKMGGGSLSLNGTNQYLATPNFNFDNEDFTIDCWIYPSRLSGNQSIFDTHYQGYNGIMFVTYENTIYIRATIDGNSWVAASAVIPAANTWHHVAAIRHGNNLYLSVNGILSAPATLNGSLVAGKATTAMIGHIPEGGSWLFNGYIDEFRISKGIARWTQDFEPEPPDGHGLLRITMSDSSEREYELSNEEINKFIAWCDHAVGTGTTLYAFDKLYNVGEFKSRKEYLVFDKIISFEVMALNR